jgi:hypothetical protein
MVFPPSPPLSVKLEGFTPKLPRVGVLELSDTNHPVTQTSSVPDRERFAVVEFVTVTPELMEIVGVVGATVSSVMDFDAAGPVPAEFFDRTCSVFIPFESPENV